VSDQSSVLRFIEDNWNLGRIGGSTDVIAGTLNNMFDFDRDRRDRRDRRLILNPQTGIVVDADSE
jgi:phospholipase C